MEPEAGRSFEAMVSGTSNSTSARSGHGADAPAVWDLGIVAGPVDGVEEVVGPDPKEAPPGIAVMAEQRRALVRGVHGSTARERNFYTLPT